MERGRLFHVETAIVGARARENLLLNKLKLSGISEMFGRCIKLKTTLVSSHLSVQPVAHRSLKNLFSSDDRQGTMPTFANGNHLWFKDKRDE